MSSELAAYATDNPSLYAALSRIGDRESYSRSEGSQKEPTPAEKAGLNTELLQRIALRFRNTVSEAARKNNAFGYLSFDDEGMPGVAQAHIQSLMNELKLNRAVVFDDGTNLDGEKLAIKGDKIIISSKPEDWDISMRELYEFIVPVLLQDEEIRNQIINDVLKKEALSVKFSELKPEEQEQLRNQIAGNFKDIATAGIAVEVARSFQEDTVQYDTDYEALGDKSKAAVVKNYKEQYEKASRAIELSTDFPVRRLATSDGDKKALIEQRATMFESFKLEEENKKLLNGLAQAMKDGLTLEQLQLLQNPDKDGSEEVKQLLDQYKGKTYDDKDLKQLIKDYEEKLKTKAGDFNLDGFIAKHKDDLGAAIEAEKTAWKDAEKEEKRKIPADVDQDTFFKAIDEMAKSEERFAGRGEEGKVKKSRIPMNKYGEDGGKTNWKDVKEWGNSSVDLLIAVLNEPTTAENADFQAKALEKMIDLSAYSRNEEIRRVAYSYLKDYQQELNEGSRKELVDKIENGNKRGMSIKNGQREFNVDSPFLDICRSLAKIPPYKISCDILKMAREIAESEGPNSPRLETLRQFALAYELKTTHYIQSRPQDLPSLNERNENWLNHLFDEDRREGSKNTWQPLTKWLDVQLKEAENTIASMQGEKKELVEEYKKICAKIRDYINGNGNPDNKLSDDNRNDVITLMNLINLVEKMDNDVNGAIKSKETEDIQNSAESFRNAYSTEFTEITEAHKNGKGKDADNVDYLVNPIRDKGNGFSFTPSYYFDDKDPEGGVKRQGDEFYQLCELTAEKRVEKIIEKISKLGEEIEIHRKDEYWFPKLTNKGSYSNQLPARISYPDGFEDRYAAKDAIDPNKINFYIGNNKCVMNGFNTKVSRHNNEPIPFNTYLTLGMVYKQMGCKFVVLETEDRAELYNIALALAMNGIDFESKVSLTSEQILELNKIRESVRASEVRYNKGEVEKTAEQLHQYVDEKKQSIDSVTRVVAGTQTDPENSLNKMDEGFESMQRAASAFSKAKDTEAKKMYEDAYRADKKVFKYLLDDAEFSKEESRENAFAKRFESKTAKPEDVDAVGMFIKRYPEESLKFILYTLGKSKDTEFKAMAKDLLRDKDLEGKDVDIDTCEKAWQILLEGKEITPDNMKSVDTLIRSIEPKNLAYLARACYLADGNHFDRAEFTFANYSKEGISEAKAAKDFAESNYAEMQKVKEDKKYKLDRAHKETLYHVLEYVAGGTYKEGLYELVKNHSAGKMEEEFTGKKKLLVWEESLTVAFSDDGIEAVNDYIKDCGKVKTNLDMWTLQAIAEKIAFAGDDKKSPFYMESLQADSPDKDKVKAEFEKIVENSFEAEKAKQRVIYGVMDGAKKYINTIEAKDALDARSKEKLASAQAFSVAAVKFAADYMENPQECIKKLEAKAKEGDSVEKKRYNDVAKKLEKNEYLNLQDIYVIASSYDSSIIPIGKIFKERQEYMKKGVENLHGEIQKTYTEIETKSSAHKEDQQKFLVYAKEVYVQAINNVTGSEKGGFYTMSGEKLLKAIDAEALRILLDDKIISLGSISKDKTFLEAVQAAKNRLNSDDDYRKEVQGQIAKWEKDNGSLDDAKTREDRIKETMMNETVKRNLMNRV